jgi:hypothetical protein
MGYSNLTSELNQTYAKTTNDTEDANIGEMDGFEEILAEAVYEGLAWVNSIVAPALDTCIQGATTVEIGLRKTRLNMRDCEALEKGLERVFGFGAKVIESRILKVLHSKLGLSKEIKSDFKFFDEVKKARELYKSKR